MSGVRKAMWPDSSVCVRVSETDDEADGQSPNIALATTT